MIADCCCFCTELAGEHSEFQARHPDLESRLIVQDSDFVVMPSLGALVPGHALLLPREHVTSFGELSAALRAEAWAIYSSVRTAMSRSFSPVACFEHGSPVGADSGGCGIVHAHIHLVPMEHRRSRMPASVGEGWRAVSSGSWLERSAEIVQQGGGYLMWQGPEDHAHLEPVGEITSQHLRRHVAGQLSNASWDWRTAQPEPAFASIITALQEALLDSATYV